MHFTYFLFTILALEFFNKIKY